MGMSEHRGTVDEKNGLIKIAVFSNSVGLVVVGCFVVGG
jgi:hypothetical protein